MEKSKLSDSDFEAFQQDMSAMQAVLKENKLKVEAMQRALEKANSPSA